MARFINFLGGSNSLHVNLRWRTKKESLKKTKFSKASPCSHASGEKRGHISDILLLPNEAILWSCHSCRRIALLRGTPIYIVTKFSQTETIMRRISVIFWREWYKVTAYTWILSQEPFEYTVDSKHKVSIMNDISSACKFRLINQTQTITRAIVSVEL